MRTVVFLDTKIDKDEALALLDEYSEFITKHTGIEPVFWVERRDFSEVPTTPDSDGDLKPTYAYRQALAKDVFDRYGYYGTDNILMWVHEDNFLYKGVWGTNWSYNHYKYSFQLCRWDKDNTANTFGTLYHEQMHSFDRLVLEELGMDIINPMFGGAWDANVVHGASSNWRYIGRDNGRENAEALKKVGPYIKQAYAVRREKFYEPLKVVQWKLIELLRQFLKI